MMLIIDPGNWRFPLIDRQWDYVVENGNISMTARGYRRASIMDYPINAHDHLPSGFSLWVDGRMLYHDHSRDMGYLIFINNNEDNVTAMTIWRDPYYDPVSDLASRIENM